MNTSDFSTQEQQACSKLVEHINKQHKEFKLFKQLIKRQSKNLEQFLNTMISISRQFGSTLFDGFHFHMTTFQQEIQNQYVLLKQQGKQFYVVKQEVANFSKKKQEIPLEEIKSSVETQYWNQKQDYSMLRMRDVQYKGEKLTQQTNIVVEEFIEQHNFRIGSSLRTNRKSDSNQSSYKKQCQVPTILTVEDFWEVKEREDYTEQSPYESLVKLSEN